MLKKSLEDYDKEITDELIKWIIEVHKNGTLI